MENSIKDIIGGALLIILGSTISYYCYENYELGTLRRMGTGFYPMAAGAILASLGAVILIPPLFRKIQVQPITLPPLRATFFVLAGTGAFAFLCQDLGLFPAITALVILSSFASPKGLSPKECILLIIGLCFLAWAVFGLGMSLGLKLFSWPF